MKVALALPILTGMSWESFVTLRNMKGPIEETLVTPMVPLSEARNCLATRFIRDTDCDAMMFAAGDMLYGADALELLLDTMARQPRAGVIVGIYHGKAYPYRPLIYEALGKPYFGYPKDGQFRVHSSGLDCALIRREVFERMQTQKGRYFRFTEKLSEDIAFAEALPEGIEMWADARVKCGHLAKVVVTEKWMQNARFAKDFLDLDTLPLWPVADERKLEQKPRVQLVRDGGAGT